MKRIFAVILSCVLMMLSSISAFAVSHDATINPRWDNTKEVGCQLVFDRTSGCANGWVTGDVGVTCINGTLAVYKQLSNGNWEYVDHTGRLIRNSREFYITVPFTAESGAYYKAVLNVTVTKNGVDENIIKFAYYTCP